MERIVKEDQPITCCLHTTTKRGTWATEDLQHGPPSFIHNLRTAVRKLSCINGPHARAHSDKGMLIKVCLNFAFSYH
ncbi:hypothetical protein J6590_036765 [Homalodisca vitripennis]|nr:hypothetical protein J6590_036765 [Homalodisca vitripennis]